MDKELEDIDLGAALQRAANRRNTENPVQYMMHIKSIEEGKESDGDVYLYVHENNDHVKTAFTDIDTAFADYVSFSKEHGSSVNYSLKNVFDVIAMQERRAVVKLPEEKIEKMRELAARLI
jgi:hypothetical protein